MPNWNKSRIAAIPVINTYNDFTLNNVTQQIKPENILVLDSETTGLMSDSLDEMVQIGIACNKQNTINDFNLKYTKNDINVFDLATKPIWNQLNVTINKFINVTTLDFNQQKQLLQNGFLYGVKANVVADILAQLLENKIVVMQNGINFDANFINKLFGMFNKHVNWACLDTMSLTYYLGLTPTKQNKPSYTQESIGNLLNVKNEKAHNAIFDCLQLYEIYAKLYELKSDKIAELVTSHYANSKLINGCVLRTKTVLGNTTKEDVTVFETPLLTSIIQMELDNKMVLDSALNKYLNSTTKNTLK